MGGPSHASKSPAIFFLLLKPIASFNPLSLLSPVRLHASHVVGSIEAVRQGWKHAHTLVMSAEEESTADLRRSSPRIQQSMADYMLENHVDAEVVYTDAELSTRTATEAADALGIADASLLVKSLVFVAASGVPLLVLAPGMSRVNVSALQKIVQCRVRFATPEEAESATGHEVGCIPPFSPSSCVTLQRYMDVSILEGKQPVYTGAGVHGGHIMIHPLELQRASNATVGDFVMPGLPPESAEILQNGYYTSTAKDDKVVKRELEECDDERDTVEQEEREREDEEEEEQEDDEEQQEEEEEEEKQREEYLPPEELIAALSTVGDALVEVRAEILRVRKIAKHLRFATLRLLPPLRGPRELEPTLAELARCGPWQLIVGKTLMENLGGAEGLMRLKQVRNGRYVAIVGKLQLNLKPQSPDIVAHQLEFIGAPSHNVKAELESGRTSAAPRPLSLTLRPKAPPVKVSEKDLLPSPEMPDSVIIVEDDPGVAKLAESIETVIVSGKPVGFDAEWRPRDLVFFPKDESEPIAVMQVATQATAFVIDMLAIKKQPGAWDSLRHCLHRLFCAPSCPKLGFSLHEDLRRLELALPGTTQGMQNVLDLQPAASEALGAQGTRTGLAAACARLLGVKLDKTQQVSDWSVRPLSSAQVSYAALDAFILLQLFDFFSALPSRESGESTEDSVDRPGVASKLLLQQPLIDSLAAHGSAMPLDASPVLRPLSTRALQLNGMDTLFDTYLGTPIFDWQNVLNLCAHGSLTEPNGLEMVSAGGRGTTRWADGSACFTINAGQTGGRYPNRFWRELRGPLAGQLLFSWWPGRGQRIADPWLRKLLMPGAKVLFFMRLKRQQGQPYYFCGRLAAVALALPAAYDGILPSEVQVWNTSKAEHIIWRLVDADALLADSEGHTVDKLFSANGIAVLRPSDYRSA